MKSPKFTGAYDLVVCRDSDILAIKARDVIVQCGREAIQQHRRFNLVLTGGSSPLKTYLLLAESTGAAAIDWSKTYVFFSDERCVAWDDPRSNYGSARKSLLARVRIPESHVFPVQTQGLSPAEAAVAYADKLVEHFFAFEHGVTPRFDLILLGMGEDGHIASLFPHAAALKVEDSWAIWSPPGMSPLVDRITLTYPVLNTARNVAFLVLGENKAIALRDVLEGNARSDDRPAAGVHPVDGKLTWLGDECAASLLTRHRTKSSETNSDTRILPMG